MEPYQEKNPRAASLFCGAGGACLGLRQAGYEVIAGVDFDPLALATYTAAGGTAVQHMITEEQPVPSEWVGRLTGLDLLWASPPCQPWSRAGKMKGAEDERDAWPATLAAVALLRPRWFIAENVRGVEHHLDEYVVLALKRLGYVVAWRCLNAADYGVPQTRQRVILVAGPERFRWPMATHGDPKTFRPLFDARKPWRSMGTALGLEGVAGPDRGAGLIARHGDRNRSTSGTAYLLQRPSPAVCATEAKGHTNPDRERGRATPIQRASDANYLATGRRRLTTSECAILQDFPTDYPWQGGVTAVYRQIGNAVPPTLSRVVAIAIKNSCETR